MISYSLDALYDPDEERKARKKLKRQHASELKGAIRELRKDNAFMHQMKTQAARERAQEVEENRKRIQQRLDEEQREINQLASKKRKMK